MKMIWGKGVIMAKIKIILLECDIYGSAFGGSILCAFKRSGFK